MAENRVPSGICRECGGLCSRSADGISIHDVCELKAHNAALQVVVEAADAALDPLWLLMCRMNAAGASEPPMDAYVDAQGPFLKLRKALINYRVARAAAGVGEEE